MGVFSYIIVDLQKLGHHIGKEQEKYMWNDIIWYNERPNSQAGNDAKQWVNKLEFGYDEI